MSLALRDALPFKPFLHLLLQLDAHPTRIEATESFVRGSGSTPLAFDDIEAQAAALLAPAKRGLQVDRRGDAAQKTRTFTADPDSGMSLQCIEYKGSPGQRDVHLTSRAPVSAADAVAILDGVPFVERLAEFIATQPLRTFRMVRLENPGWTIKGYGEFASLDASQLERAASWLRALGLAPHSGESWGHPENETWVACLDVRGQRFRADLTGRMLAPPA